MVDTLQHNDPLFQKHPVRVAKSLLGIIIKVGDSSGRIVETEAYTGPPEDLASHAHTRTNSASELMHTVGKLYIYSIHGGIATNITCGTDKAGAVLLRAIEPVTGIHEMVRRRSRPGTKISKSWNVNNLGSLRSMTNGPNKLTEALGIKKTWSNTKVGDRVYLLPGNPPKQIITTERIGISRSKKFPWRVCDAESAFLSRTVS